MLYKMLQHMPNRIKSLKWLFIALMVKLRLRQKEVQPSQAKLSNIFTSCDELTLDRFEKCLYHKDLTALIKEGTASPLILAEVWDKIQIEYCDLSADKAFKGYIEDKSIEVSIALRIAHIKSLCALLKERYDPIYIEALKKYDYYYDFNPNNIDSYLFDIERVLGSLIHDELKIEQVKQNIDTYIEMHKGVSDTQGYFDSTLAKITKGLGLKFIPLKRETTVSQFCHFINLLREQNGG